MKKLLKGLLLSGLIASSVYGAKVATADEYGRLYNTAYFDIKPFGQSPIYDVIAYTKRGHTFDWEKFYKALSEFTGDKIDLAITTRVEIPNSIKTNDVYITVGKTHYFNKIVDHGSDGAIQRTYNTKKKEPDDSDFGLHTFKTYINEKQIIGSDSILTKTKPDSFGNKYIELKITYNLILPEYLKYRLGTPDKPVREVFNKTLNEVKIKVAPKSRTFQSKWVEPKIYVMDE